MRNNSWEQIDTVDEPMTALYFTPANIRADLQAYADALGKEINDLIPYNLKLQTIFTNGETFSGVAYIHRYGVIAGLARTVKEAKIIESQVCEELKQIAIQGVPREELILSEELTTKDAGYFAVQTLKADLTAFAEDAGTDLDGLSSKRFEKVLCISGEKLYFDTYVNRASKTLFGIGAIETQKNRGSILKRIKSLIGIEAPDEMTVCYFTQAAIHEDIKSFADAAERLIGGLTLGRGEAKAECSNGETIALNTYCRRIGIVLGYAKTNTKVKPLMKEILAEIQEIAGEEVEKFNEAYLTEQNVRVDLEAFAKSAGVSVENLNTSHNSTKVLCKNGLEMTLDKYLFWTGRVWGFGPSYLEVVKHFIDIRNRLFNLIGVKTEERIKYPKMTFDYFTNENILADLNAWAKACGQPVEKVRSNWSTKKFVACNGEKISAKAYLARAGKVFGLNKKDAEIIRFLKRMVGIGVEVYSLMDSDYFNDLEKLRADLEAFTLQAKKGSIQDLFTNQMHHIAAICTNGESINGVTYLTRAGIVLGLAKNSKEAGNMHTKIFNELKKKLDVKIHEKMDLKYFNNSKKVRADLEAFAQVLGVEVGRMYQSYMLQVKATCCNGETIEGRAYVHRAGKAYGFAENNVEAKKCVRKIFNKLIEIANA